MSMDTVRFRSVMGRFATGVTLVTGRDREGAPVGLTANAVASVSLDPPLLLVCLDRGSASRPVLEEAGSFAVSILRAGQGPLARRFSREDPEERFRDLALREEVTGAPILDGALGWADCRLWRTVEAGDHTILLGEVVACGGAEDDDPLVFYCGRFGTFEP